MEADDGGWTGYSSGRTWLERERGLARIARPALHFLHLETAGGVVLLIATVASLILANTGAGDEIADFWHKELVLFEIGDWHLEEDLVHWINDGLMAIFFFVVGLEIKRELVTGELTDPRRAALPAVAALGGMIVPAAVYLVFNAGGPASDGWGIPMATDIAFAVGVMALLGNRVPSSLKVFLLTLAIVDDIGAILVIAIFYTESISTGWLVAAVALVGLVLLMRLARVWYVPAYVVVGFFVWLAVLESGVHATIAGVVLGLITPAKPLRPRPTEVEIGPETSWNMIKSTLFDAKESVPVAERLQHAIHPWSSFVILPLFAFANAGIVLSGETISEAATAAVTIGIVLGLVVGKPVGILLFSWIAVATNLATRPREMTWIQITGAGALAGIGFTVSLFVTGLAFNDPLISDEAKIGILFASTVAAILGAALLVVGQRAPHPEAAELDVIEEPAAA